MTRRTILGRALQAAAATFAGFLPGTREVCCKCGKYSLSDTEHWRNGLRPVMLIVDENLHGNPGHLVVEEKDGSWHCAVACAPPPKPLPDGSYCDLKRTKETGFVFTVNGNREKP